MYHASPFDRFAKWISRTAGHPATFAAAVLIILVWATLGPLFGFSNTWQLAINTGTTIITFLMVGVLVAYVQSGCHLWLLFATIHF